MKTNVAASITKKLLGATFTLAFNCMVSLSLAIDFATLPNDESGRSRLSEEIYTTAGVFAGVSENNFFKARALAEELFIIKAERIQAAQSRYLELTELQLRALVRMRYSEFLKRKGELNEVEVHIREQLDAKEEKDLAIGAQISEHIQALAENTRNDQMKVKTEEPREAAVPPKSENAKAMDSWLGFHKSELFKQWGVPTRIVPDGQGGEVLAYEQSETVSVGRSDGIGTSSITLTPSATQGSINGLGFDVSSDVTRVRQRTITAYREIFVDESGIIRRWRTGTR
jgi:hypothetical protein